MSDLSDSEDEEDQQLEVCPHDCDVNLFESVQALRDNLIWQKKLRTDNNRWCSYVNKAKRKRQGKEDRCEIFDDGRRD